jgi:hypothetical protein
MIAPELESLRAEGFMFLRFLILLATPWEGGFMASGGMKGK